MSQTIEVTVKATGQKIKVYQLTSGKVKGLYQDYDKMSAEYKNQKTTYSKEELIGLPS